VAGDIITDDADRRDAPPDRERDRRAAVAPAASRAVADTTLAIQTRRLVNETRAGIVVTDAYFRSGNTK